MNKKELQARMAPPVVLPAPIAKEKTSALATIGPLERKMNAIVVKDEGSCQKMDTLLGEVVQARKGWGSIWARIHEKSIAPIMQGINNLHEVNRAIDGPLKILEDKGKKAIKDFRVADQKRIEAAWVEEARLSQESEALQARIDNARTLTRRAELIEKKEVIDTQIVKKFEESTQIVTENSGHRTKPAWRLIGSEVGSEDMPPSLMVVLEGILSGDIPPEVICIDVGYIRQVFSKTPEVVASWPGFEVYDDIQIVRK